MRQYAVQGHHDARCSLSVFNSKFPGLSLCGIALFSKLPRTKAKTGSGTEIQLRKK